MRWHPQSTQGTSTKSCWSPLWLHSSWVLACSSYYSGSASMYEGTVNELWVWIFLPPISTSFHWLALLCLPCFSQFQATKLKRHIPVEPRTSHTQHELDLIGLYWQYSGIIWTGFLFTSKDHLYNFWCPSLSLSAVVPINGSQRFYIVT